MARWTVGAARDLPIAERESWDGPAAAAGVFSWAGWPDNPDSGKARRAFLVYDADAPDLKGSYKLPFAQVAGGRLVASRAGLRAAASRLPQTDAPSEVLSRARRVLDGYFRREESALMPMMEIKSVAEVRTVEERVVTGFPSVFGNVDEGGDLVEPGAYVKTLDDRGHRLRWLWQHDRAQPPIAKILEIGEVGKADLPEGLVARFPEATGGLRVKREYLDTPRGNEVLEAIRSGALSEMSIGYDVMTGGPPPTEMVVNGKPVRRLLKEIRLWEMSDVNWGMNAATENVKALWLDAPAEEIAEQLREAGRLAEIMALAEAEKAARPVGSTVEERRRRLALLAQQLGL